MSATTSQPAIPMANSVQSQKLSEFAGYSNINFPESTLNINYSKTYSTWKCPGNDFWTVNKVGGTFNIEQKSSNACDENRSCSLELHDRSSSLGVTAKAKLWLNHSWDQIRNTPPTFQQLDENDLFPDSRNLLQNSVAKNVLEIENAYQKSLKSNYDRSVSFLGSQTKNPNGQDPISCSPKSVRKVTKNHQKNDKNVQQNTISDEFRVGQSRFLPTESTSSRDGSVMSSGAFKEQVNANTVFFENGNIQTEMSAKNTLSNYFPSQGPSYLVLDSSPARKINTQNFDLTSSRLDPVRENGNTLEDNSSPILQSRHSHNNAYHRLQYFSSPKESSTWNQNSKETNIKEVYSNQISPNLSHATMRHELSDREHNSSTDMKSQRSSGKLIYPHVASVPNGRSDFKYSRITQSPNSIERKLSNDCLIYPSTYAFGTPVQSQMLPHVFELPYPTFKSEQKNLTFGCPVFIQPYQHRNLISDRSPRDQDVGTGFRSALLEEFRNNIKCNKKYELKDLYHHIVEFSGDQHGSRFIQMKLETANSDDREQIFREIQTNALQLTTDVYGNYVIQKLFEHGNQLQKRMLAEQLKNHVMELSLQMYGCRVVQKALEHVLDDQQAKLVEELQVDILKCIKDQNGNHVVQKAIERVPSQHIQFIIDAFHGKVIDLAIHPYGCRVIQRLLEFSKSNCQKVILKELHECSEMLIFDQYGNYVIQHMIQHGTSKDRDQISNLVTGKLLKFSRHKFASNVVEKSIIFGTDEQRQLMVSLLTASNNDGTSSLQLMMKDQFGNYVIQKLLTQLRGTEKIVFLSAMKTQLLQLKKFNYSKQIDVIEKLLLHSSQSPPSEPVSAIFLN